MSSSKEEIDEEDEILQLIRIVDRNYESHWYDLFLYRPIAFPLWTIFALLLLVETYLWAEHPIQEKLGVALPFIAIVIAFFALIYHGVEEMRIERNFARFGKCVTKDKQPLLIALIKMRSQYKFDLELVYGIDNSTFSVTKLLERLYK